MLHPAPRTCPVSGGEMIITRLYCPDSGITIEGRFSFGGGLGSLSLEQLAFVETFVRCEGKINRVQKELGISYPTVRSRLEEVILAMGYELDEGEEEDDDGDAEARTAVLDALSRGEITSEEAIKRLQGD